MDVPIAKTIPKYSKRFSVIDISFNGGKSISLSLELAKISNFDISKLMAE